MAPRRSWAFPALCLLLQFSLCRAKVASGLLSLGGDRKRWVYITKFGYDIGRGTWKARFKLRTPKTVAENASLRMEIYLDEEWPEAEVFQPTCDRSSKAREVRNMSLPKNHADWSDWSHGSMKQNIRPHVWYFVITDCNYQLRNYTHRLHYEVEMLQEDESHFSVEMKSLLSANVLFLALFSGFIFVYIGRCRSFSRSAGSVHPVIWVLTTAMIMQYLGQLLHTIHLSKYTGNGQGVKPLEVISEIFFMVAQVIQTSLLILIGLGYTLIQSNIGELDLMIPMCFLIAMIHGMLVGIGKIQDDSASKFHENEGIVGWVLLIMRLLLYVWFMWACGSTAADKGSGMKLRQFLSSFRAAGSLYFLSYPLIFVIFKQFAPYLQHRLMSMGLMAMQMSSNIWLAKLFLTRGDYFQVSTLSNSDLPGGIKVGMVKEE